MTKYKPLIIKLNTVTNILKSMCNTEFKTWLQGRKQIMKIYTFNKNLIITIIDRRIDYKNSQRLCDHNLN